jgi:dTDP-4-dehydrorhamnose reductase
MRILVFGAAGMLGHRVMQRLAATHQTWGTVREPAGRLPSIPGVSGERLLPTFDAEDAAAAERVIERISPDVIINCIGIVKQRAEAKDVLASIAINAMFPHRLARIVAGRGARLIHFSTDCVFSGRAGPYSETDIPDPTDLYGRSKLLGEVDYAGCLTLRTSIVGLSLRAGTGLFDWFFAQRGGRVRGFRQALYTGLTTDAMADLVSWLIDAHPTLSGLWQVSAEPIDKFSMLQLVNSVHGLGITIEPDDDFHCDRRLDSSAFRATTGWTPSSWQSMVETMLTGPLSSAANG